MAGYAPQQHYGPPPPQPGPYHGPPYGMHPGAPPVHHPYPPHMQPPPPPPHSGPYSIAYAGGPASGPSNAPWAEQQRYDPQPPPPGSVMHGGPPGPPPQQSQQQVGAGPPNMSSRPGYSNAGPMNGVGQPSLPPPPPPPTHQGQPSHPVYGHPHLRDTPPYRPGGPSQQPPPPPLPQSMPAQASKGQAQSNQRIPVQPSRPAQGSGGGGKRGNVGVSGGGSGNRGNAAAGAGKSSAAKRQEKAGGAAGARASVKGDSGMGMADAILAEHDGPVQESKKIRKRKEVVDRIHRVHWDTLENRDLLYNEMQQALATTGSLLLLSPGLSRPYLLALNRLTLERDAQLRQIALLHAHQVESARTAYEQDKAKVEDEARNAKRAVRERLLVAVEERRKRLREDKEGGGEGTADALLDSSTRAHATRKLRNKAPGPSRRDGALEPEGTLSLSARARASNANNGGNSDAEGANTPIDGKPGSPLDVPMGNPLLGSLLELTGFRGASGSIAALPPSNFDALTSGAQTASLLHLGVGGGMGDSSYMAGLRATLQNHGKSKKKTAGAKTATAAVSAGNAINGGLVAADGVVDDEDDDPSTRSMAAAAAAAALAAATMLSGNGRLRWDQGKSVGQLTSAKDIEIESDLINIRKVGNKRRRR